MSKVKAISVTQLSRRIRNLLEIEIGEIWVEGEVATYGSSQVVIGIFL